MRFQKVYLEITNICNLRCAFCPGTAREPYTMTEPEFRLYLERLQDYTEYLYFHLMGEPLLHPQLTRFLQLAGEYGFRVILTTNGTLLPETGDGLLSCPALHKVNISLHSFEANSTASPEDYLRECCVFAKKASRNGVITSFRLWNLDGAETSGLNSKNSEVLGVLHREFPDSWQENSRGVKLAERVYLNYAERFSWPELSAKDMGEHCFCYGLKDQLGVLCDGTAVPCCLDSDGTIALGNLKEQTLAEILDAPRTRAMIDGFQRRTASEELCRHCGYASRFAKR